MKNTEEIIWDDLEYYPEYDDAGCIGDESDGNWEWALLDGEMVGKRRKRRT